ncbi:bifunctional adenosylcobinamide kinase/adenosylcobinamide-phosphate guanylyltransferase [Candidatus Poribacteria bacterium]|nr:bifunctional adenosylcobinamide kinase/adenosylcobinamide-phosphate guanylyltransferase [Candidatus Poribacteria bacterium]
MSFTFITGGARSGKSTLALKLARECAARPESVAFIATAVGGDGEMTERIRKHREERPSEWTTYEEPFAAAAAVRRAVMERHDVVILDCVTLLVSNWLCREPTDAMLTDERTDATLAEVHALAEAASECHAHAIVVTNEGGMGIVPLNDLARRFRDVAGTANQMLAAAADEVYLCASGIPILIKGETGGDAR